MTRLGGALLLVGLAGASGCVTSIGSDLARDAPVARDRLGPVRRVRVELDAPIRDAPDAMGRRLRGSLADVGVAEVVVVHSGVRTVAPCGDHAAAPATPAAGVDELVVTARACRRMWCGTGEAASLAGAILTAGILPYAGADDRQYAVRLVRDGEEVGRFDVAVDTSVIGWPPLLPVMPFNLAWRWIRGDMSDEFERRLAAELRALLRHAPAGEADRRPPGDTAAARLLPAWTIEDLRIDRSTIVQYGRARGSGWCSWASATYRSS